MELSLKQKMLPLIDLEDHVGEQRRYAGCEDGNCEDRK